MVIITIEKSNNQSFGNDYLMSMSNNNKVLYARLRAGQDPGNAAAMAARAAMGCTGRYHIIAPKAVIDLIPVEFRSGTMNL